MFKRRYSKRVICPAKTEKLFAALIAAVFSLGGCGPQVPKEIVTCPGAESSVQALLSLKSKPENMVSLKANGQCRLRYYVDEKPKPQTENFNVKLWFNPPSELYLQGDIALNARGLVLGSNDEEFWFSVKPEVSSYWWGRWSELKNSAKFMISPEILLEVVGVVKTDASASFSAEEGFDVIVKKNIEGGVSKKIYIDRCTHQVVKIIYFDKKGNELIDVQLDTYTEVVEGFFVPSKITISGFNEGEGEDSVYIRLGSVKEAELSKKQKVRLFNRPKPKGFKHIYQVNTDFELIEQLQ